MKYLVYSVLNIHHPRLLRGRVSICRTDSLTAEHYLQWNAIFAAAAQKYEICSHVSLFAVRKLFRRVCAPFSDSRQIVPDRFNL